MNADEKLTMTFTVREWRLIAAACIRVKPGALLNGTKVVPILHDIASHITMETGK